METVYTVSEGVGSVEVCVNLTQPQSDILNESVVVKVINFSSSVFIPTNVRLASESLLFIHHYYCKTDFFHFSDPDIPNSLNQLPYVEWN